MNAFIYGKDVVAPLLLVSKPNSYSFGMPSLDPFAMPETGYVLEAGAMDWKGSLRRLIYPAKEKLTNEANYNEAVARLSDGDNTTSRMWWDCRTNIED